MGRARIAVIGIGLAYPDADSPSELWGNVLAGRRAFRDIPACRTNLDDYFHTETGAPDHFYSRKAAVLRDYEFDRVAHRVSAPTFRATDLTHWLALDVVGRALADAGFPGGAGLPVESTGVILGNTLTGEFSRAHLMRLRWPYVRRSLAALLRERDFPEADIESLLAAYEPTYKAPFPTPGEDTLAGGLANTIAGRICNYFDFGGGGYTVDGACSSSLLSVINAANALRDGTLDIAVAGGVDLSIDPFELVGFARTGALSTDEMKIYDADSNGFWPGEGCGVVTLMREPDAVAAGHHIYACLAGWGISSDGKGGITRPEVAGHRRAINRAYDLAGYGSDTVSYFEGHGTGTAVGDETEINALASTRDDSSRVPAALGSIKANIGHTKAAAGVAGMIKAILSVHYRTIPPITGHHRAHPALTAATGKLYAPDTAQPWPQDQPLRAGVSAMGFGGINTHIAIEQTEVPDRSRPVPTTSIQEVVRGRQDLEVLLLEGEDFDQITQRARQVRDRLVGASMAELADIANAASVSSTAPIRAAVIARTVEDGVARMDALLDRLASRTEPAGLEQVAPGCSLASPRGTPRIGFVFPGQGAGTGHHGAVLRRFDAPSVDASYLGDNTAQVQPRIVARSLDTLSILERCGVRAQHTVGHSLGEITALAWAGTFTAAQAATTAAERGRLMSEMARDDGAMAVVHADSNQTENLIGNLEVSVSGINAPALTVVAGRADQVADLRQLAERRGVRTTSLSVNHAFHTEDFRSASEAFGEWLSTQALEPVSKQVTSTTDGQAILPSVDLAAHLSSQMVKPVHFVDAVLQMSDCDLIVEVGPGTSLRTLVSEILPNAVVTQVDSDSASLQSFAETIATAHTLGCEIDLSHLSHGRLVKHLDLAAEPQFLESPCESAPSLGFDAAAMTPTVVTPGGPETTDSSLSTIDVLRGLIAERVELPLDMVHEDTKPLDELHLSSITIGQIANDAVRALGRPALPGVPSFATASVQEIATMLDELQGTDDRPPDGAETVGAAPWVRSFTIFHAPEPLAAPTGTPGQSTWSVVGEHNDLNAVAAALGSLPGSDGVVIDGRGDDTDHAITTVLAAFSDLRDRRTAPVRVLALENGTRGLGAAMKSLHLEHPSIPVTVVHLPTESLTPELVAALKAEVADNSGFVESHYSTAGTRTVPRLAALPPANGAPPLGSQDVLLATGGAKGITAEACMALARKYGLAVGMVGRSPADAPDVAATLRRLAEDGIRHCYVQAALPGETSDAADEVTRALGPVTAVLHGAGMNEPKSALELQEEDVRESVRPKVDGLAALLGELGTEHLKVVIGFSSIIGRSGLHGEAHYALANHWLSEDLAAFGRHNPQVRVRALEWSVWSGSGMGERLGVVERLKQEGIEAIDTDRGLAALIEAVESPDHPVISVVGARTGHLPTAPLVKQDLPLGRFLERTLVHYPEIELIVEANLSPNTDPYLRDHQLDGDLIFPAVLGLEAMTQTAQALVGSDSPPQLERVAFERPIVVSEPDGESIRVCAVQHATGDVEVVIRAAATGFAADHFRATLRFHSGTDTNALVPQMSAIEPISLDPGEELYGGILFQRGRFRKLCSYQRANARAAALDVDPSQRTDWFAEHLPGRILLGDPGARDALMHSLQCCVPDATLLPESVERIEVVDTQSSGPLTVTAREREGDGHWFVYDLTARDKSGQIVEQWRGLRLRAVTYHSASSMAWSPAFLGSYLQRQSEMLLDGKRDIVVEPHQGALTVIEERRTTTRRALSRIGVTDVRYRSDGKPEASADGHISASHGDGLTLASASSTATAVDVERVCPRSLTEWSDLLGADCLATAQTLAAETETDLDTSATRVWGALECLRKVGQVAPHVHLGTVHEDGWVRLNSGSHPVATWIGSLQDGSTHAFAILSREAAA